MGAKRALGATFVRAMAATVVVAATMCASTPPVSASSGGAATAQAVSINWIDSPITGPLDFQGPIVTAPATNGTATDNTLGVPPVGESFGAVTNSATRGPTSTSAISSVADVSVDVLGQPFLRASSMASSARCNPDGTVSSQTAASGLSLLGTVINVTDQRQTVTADIPGFHLEGAVFTVSTLNPDGSFGAFVRVELFVTPTGQGTAGGIWLFGHVTCTVPNVFDAPTVTSVSPGSGPTAGGTPVTVTGTNFVPGETSVTIGGTQVTANVASDTTLTFTTPPAAVAGPAAVNVTTAGGTGTGTFTYLAVPTLIGITPNAGPTAGGTGVTAFGSGFVTGATTVTIGGTVIPAGQVTVDSPTQLRFATPAHAAGAVDVTATTGGGTSTAVTYTYVAAPTATVLSPTSGPTAGGTLVTITGSGFVTGATSVTIGGITVPAASVTVISGTTLTFVTPMHAAGGVAVTVTTPGGTSAPALTYTYLDTPTLTALSPDSGPITGGPEVTATGSAFVAGATTVTIGGAVIAAGQVTVDSPTQLRFTPPAHAAGPVGVTVTTPGGTSTPALTYTYLAAPTATALSPDSGPTAGGTDVSITGTGFIVDATTVTLDGTDIATGDVTVTSATSLTFTTPAHAAGPVGVTVTTPGGTSTPALTYTYLAAPTATALSPTAGPLVGGTTLTVTGTGFAPGATTVAVQLPAGGALVTIGAAAVTVSTDGTTASFAAPPSLAVGDAAITLTTAGGTTAALTYSYLPVPTTSSLGPTSGPTTGGNTLTITGTGFAVGGTTVKIGATTIPASAVTVGTGQAAPTVEPAGALVQPLVALGTTLSVTVPAGTAGAVEVTVTTAGGTSSPPLTYTYVGPPTATSLSPTSGPTSGGTAITVVGTGFVPGATAIAVTLTNGQVVAIPTSQVTVGADGLSLLFVSAASPVAGNAGVVVITPGGRTAPLTFQYTLPLTPVTPVTPVTPATPVVVRPATTLPATGSNVSPLLAWAGALVAGGCGLVLTARWRRRHIPR